MYGTGRANFMVDTIVKKFGHTKVGLLNLDRAAGASTGRGEPASGALKENWSRAGRRRRDLRQ